MTAVRHRITDPDEDARTGTCSICGPVPIYRSGSYRGKIYYRCAPTSLALSNARYPDVSEAQRERIFIQKYGITVAQYDEMLAAQDGVCYRCKKPPKEDLRLAVDHNHVTGELRKLLCGPCNTYIGRLEANIMNLLDDLAYIGFADDLAGRLVA